MSASVLPALLRAEGAAEAHREMPMPPMLYGILALAALLLLLALVWSFRGTAYKVRDRHAADGGQH